MRDIAVRKPMPTRFAGRPKIRWENDVKEDLRIMKINDNASRTGLNGRQ
jgi:hypothetical protein